MTKIVLMTISGIALTRLILVLVCLLFGYVFALFATCCRSNPKDPLSKCRRAGSFMVRVFLRIALFFVGFIWIPVTDHRKNPSSARVLVANHVALWDPIKIVFSEGVCVAAKSDAFNTPLFGRLLSALEVIPIFRESTDGRKASLQAVVDRCKDERFPPFLIFPQGTTTNTKVLTSFKKGAFAAGVPVCPVIIRYPGCAYDHYLGPSDIWEFWRGLCQVISFCTIEYLEEYIPNDQEKANADLYAENVRNHMAKAMGVEVTDHDFSDVRMAVEAHRNRLKVDFVVSDVTKVMNSSFDDLRNLMRLFKSLDSDKDGSITFEQFCEAIGLKPTHSVSQRLFELFDTDASGLMDFSEFLVAMSIGSAHCSATDAAKVLFECCDQDGDSKISKDDLKKALNFAKQAPRPAIATLATTTATPATSLIDKSKSSAPKLERQASYSERDMQAAVDELTTELTGIIEALFSSENSSLPYDEFMKLVQANPKIVDSMLNLFLWKKKQPRPADSHAHSSTSASSSSSALAPTAVVVEVKESH